MTLARCSLIGASVPAVDWAKRYVLPCGLSVGLDDQCSALAPGISMGMGSNRFYDGAAPHASHDFEHLHFLGDVFAGFRRFLHHETEDPLLLP